MAKGNQQNGNRYDERFGNPEVHEAPPRPSMTDEEAQTGWRNVFFGLDDVYHFVVQGGKFKLTYEDIDLQLIRGQINDAESHYLRNLLRLNSGEHVRYETFRKIVFAIDNYNNYFVLPGEQELLKSIGFFEMTKANPATEKPNSFDTIKIPEKLREALKKDYEEQMEVHYLLGTLERGKDTYVSDLLGLEGRIFKVPTFEACLKQLTPGQLARREKWQQEGITPMMTVTPIGLKLKTVANKMRATRGELLQKHPRLRLNNNIVDVGDLVKDGELIYSPTAYDATNPDELKVIGGMSKAEFAEEKGGFLVGFIPMVQEEEPDSEIISDASGKKFTNAQKVAGYHRQDRTNVLAGLTHDSYLNAQFLSLWLTGKPLDKKYWTILTGSALKDPKVVSVGFWLNGRVVLGCRDAGYRNDGLRRRRSDEG